MATASLTVPISATADAVWAVVGDFGALADWHPLVPNCRWSEDRAARVIDVPGMKVVETLDRAASPAMGHAYTVDKTPMPVTDYAAVVEVIAHEEGCALHYRSTFTPVGVSDADAAAMLVGFFTMGFDAVATRFGQTG